ncbi:MAG: hypothetical protein AAGA99_11210 [Actinomycetota bacterium]
MTPPGRQRRRIDLRDPLVDLRDVVVRPEELPELDEVGIELAEHLAEIIDDPQVDLLLERVRNRHG